MTKIAIVVVHGVEISDATFADTTIARLTELFARETGLRASQARAALAFRPVHWAPVFEKREVALLRALYPRGRTPFRALRRLVEKVNTGSKWWLLPFLAFASRNSDQGLKYPSWRWLLTHFVGDIIAYQRTPERSTDYDAVHDLYERALQELALEAGKTAPLCVLAHSFGSIISSDFFYDLQRPGPSARPSPLERGETLCNFFTMGSPMALWALRYPQAALDSPIRVPHPKLLEHQRGLRGVGSWINFYDDDDVLGTPLRALSEAYQLAVAEDIAVRIGGPLFSTQPLVHPFYWSDDSVLGPIASRLARVWRGLDAAKAAVA